MTHDDESAQTVEGGLPSHDRSACGGRVPWPGAGPTATVLCGRLGLRVGRKARSLRLCQCNIDSGLSSVRVLRQMTGDKT